MDLLITVLRFPVGAIGGLVIIVFCLIMLVLETVALVFVLPLAAILQNRQTFRRNWIVSNYPVAVEKLRNGWQRIWQWVFSD